MTPKNLIYVVEESIVNFIVGSRLFMQLESSFNVWEPWAHIAKISPRYHNYKKGLNSLFSKIFISDPVMSKLEYGGVNFVPIAKSLF